MTTNLYQRIATAQKFISSPNLYRTMRAVMASLLVKDATEIGLTMRVDETSWTDGSNIMLALPVYALKYEPELTKRQWMVILRAVLGHECQHINSTPMKYVELAQKSGKKYLGNEDIGQNMFNIIEDGRIERIAAIRHPGLRVPLMYKNHIMLGDQTIEKDSPKANPLQDFVNQAWCYAKVGMDMPGYDTYKGHIVEDIFEKCRPHIDTAILAETCEKCFKQTEIVLELMKPLMQFMPTQDDLFGDCGEGIGMMTGCSGNSENKEYEKNDRQGAGVRKIIVISSPNQEEQQNSSEPENGEGGSTDNQTTSQNGTGSERGESSSDTQSKNKSEAGQDNKTGASGDGEDNQNHTEGGGHLDGFGTTDQGGVDADGKAHEQEGKNGAQEAGNSADNASQNGSGGQGSTNETNSKPAQDGTDADESSKQSDDTFTQSSPQNGEQANQTNNPTGQQAGSSNAYNPAQPLFTMEELDRAVAACNTNVSPSSKMAKGDEHSTLTPKELKAAQQDCQSNFQEVFVNCTSQPLPADFARRAAALHSRFERILRKKKEAARGQTKGRLDTGNLWKASVAPRTIWYRKGQPLSADCAIMELIDNSGSMDGTKTTIARTVGGMLECALCGLAAMKVTLFNHTNGAVNHYTVRDFNQHVMPKDSYVYGSLQAVYAGGCNRDGSSIRVATAALARRPERNKILIVLSDGLPSAYANDNIAMQDVHQAVQDARRQGIIVISILVGSNNECKRLRPQYIKMYGKDHISCEPSAMLGMFEKLLTKLMHNA